MSSCCLFLNGQEMKCYGFLSKDIENSMAVPIGTCHAVFLSERDNELHSFQRQMKLPQPTNPTAELVPAAMELFKRRICYPNYSGQCFDVTFP